MNLPMACVFAGALLIAVNARAAAPPDPPTPPQISAPERAFLSLSEDDRKAAQDALGWLGFYNGVVDGTAGKRTLEALKTYQESVGARGDGIVSDKTLAALKDAAVKAKAAVGFKIVDDPETGMRIGAPLKLIEKRVTTPNNAVYMSKDGQVQLFVRKIEGGLAGHFASMTGARANTKVTYKFLKAGAFYVVASEVGEAKSYDRYNADGDNIRGFTFIYPKARAKALDPVALAIANAFDPFPAKAAPVAVTTPTAPPPPPAPPKLTATALIVSPGVAVTKLDPAACAAPTVAGKPARFLDPQGGLTRLGGEFGAGAAAPPLGAGGDDLLALSVALDNGREVLRAEPVQTLDGGRVLAALPPSASGAPLFDRQGRLAGFVAAVTDDARRGAVTLAGIHATASAAPLGVASSEGGAALSVADIAALRRKAVVGVFCPA